MLSAKEIAVVPPGSYEMNQTLFTYDPKVPDSEQSFWKLLDKLLNPQKINLKVSNLQELGKPSSIKKVLKNTSFFICNNIPQWACGDWKERIKHIPLERRVLILWEPPVIIPHQYTEKAFAQFGKILTWDDSLVDNKKFFKFQYPSVTAMVQSRPSFSEKRLLTQMSANKTANGHFSSELYSERHRAIQFFEQHPEIEFDFYGPGWGEKGYLNYKGTPQDKFGTLKQYKFSLCFENMKNIQGYITEKIFHCFGAGCVPIYYGASNISKYIPQGCYILFDPSKGYEALTKELTEMSEETYNQYITNIENFLQSQKAKEFSQKSVARMIKRALISETGSTKKKKNRH